MPELPDLQAFSHNLTKVLKGRKLLKLNVVQSKKLNVSADELVLALQGQVLNKVVREGKTLQLKFSNNQTLGLHLMLHGALRWFDSENTHKFTILELYFDGDKSLALTDFQKAATPTLNPKKADAPDALDKEVDEKFWKQKFVKSKKPVKAILMDQKVVRGIGNAYADEIFYDAGLSPFSIASKIPDDEIKVLSKSIRKVLEDAEKQIFKVEPDIINGEVRDFFNVHRPKQKTTPRGETILQEELSSRKTYYVKDQKLFD
ncbi:DNA-formamidopyrimidine glycosylase family protein [Mucilaginibacter terrae]|uniref:Formamidopyrimidine-DNA glycosylase n=1 Tax=Mucilaginibacter terrae TaxID=1955052 RepID=A0ABU3GYQ1_9SPHI|nr:DNA-formamidopyrimidine glycosylase family protein [Mucilaginibacter terrae]MDT3404893.1 formamidopyrimidine-DNA glycosylase [Mucilaginibacter terrae]